jgi:hypothetical protein
MLITYARIEGGKPAQLEVLRVLFADIESILGLCVRPREERTGLAIYFSSRDEDGNNICKSQWLGYYFDKQIYLRPGLRGNELYAVALHELGHYWGLDHTRRGIMAAVQNSSPAGRLSVKWRRRCLRSLMGALLRNKLRRMK